MERMRCCGSNDGNVLGTRFPSNPTVGGDRVMIKKQEIALLIAVLLALGLVFGCQHNDSVKSHFVGNTGPVAVAPR